MIWFLWLIFGDVQASFDTAMDQAKATGKPVLIYGSSELYPMSDFEEQRSGDPSLKKALKKVVFLEIDGDSSEGFDFFNTFGLNKYLGFVLLSPDGQRRFEWDRYEVSEFDQIIDAFIAGRDPFTVFEDEFERNKSAETAFSVANLAMSSGRFADAERYFKKAYAFGQRPLYFESMMSARLMRVSDDQYDLDQFLAELSDALERVNLDDQSLLFLLHKSFSAMPIEEQSEKMAPFWKYLDRIDLSNVAKADHEQKAYLRAAQSWLTTKSMIKTKRHLLNYLSYEKQHPPQHQQLSCLFLMYKVGMASPEAIDFARKHLWRPEVIAAHQYDFMRDLFAKLVCRKEANQDCLPFLISTRKADSDYHVLNGDAWTCYEAGIHTPEVLEWAKKAVRFAPEENGFKASCLDTLACLYFVLGQESEALAAIREAIEIDPGDEDFKERLREFKEKKQVAGH